MTKNKIVTWTAIIIVFIIWNLFRDSVSFWIYLSLTKIGLPMPIIQLILVVLPPILLLEIIIKLLFWQIAMPPLKFVSTQAESWQNLNQYELACYTSILEELGFVQLTDYTSPSIPGMARLFAHPQRFCFAEVGQVNKLPMFCSISCHLEKDWLLAVTNMSFDRILYAISYAFMRQPRNLVKRFENESVNLLLQSLLDWRTEVSSDLGLELIQDMRAETYFEKERNKRIEQRRSLLRKSITWGLL
ncbi:MAG TPA: hypothetical protein DEG17_04570 [Cyanobacteria bacterium UBA11149]|nr:hypothetical protein [Cyanobacteria bacterium UBA11367]HBE58289.1 hypothetical protein [Cyanobacteria bacterium UBA11366]HBK64365.1 hypothetical protein [Cyanobacteria bacterium UBA11166]HBR73018.1 hypothetical protein [Cyanobacteria bacterium UBA11159]HBS68896.1 hypothetical protein [Cyanobacteria bacterium UBA11153]HBW88165.1 hypothetical protein [Cyanobacteria bacterium UBA11149]HCA97208.1 hypothetical protein [Cyanobacteria bacterium UBA9226]